MKKLSPEDRFRWAEDIRKNATIFQTREYVQKAVQNVAQQICREMSMLYPVVLSVMSGSLVFCADVIRQLDFPLDFDYIDVARYRESVHPGDLHWLVKPTIPLEGRRVLLIDDILDQGVTLHSIYQWLIEQGVLDVKIAVLCQRAVGSSDRKVSADYFGMMVPENLFIFGYGMDVYGFWRNLPSLYVYCDPHVGSD